MDPSPSSTIRVGMVKATGSQLFILGAGWALLISLIAAHVFRDPPVRKFAEIDHHLAIDLRETVPSVLLQ